MTATIKLPRRLLRSIQEDLARPHPFALERVGWVFARVAREARGLLMLGVDYASVADEHYIDDPTVGARVNADAIRPALERALKSQDCVIHVHAHDHGGSPRFSPVDAEGLQEMMPSFRVVAPSAVHGALVLSRDRATGLVWMVPGRNPMPAKVVLVGSDLAICECEP